MSHRLAEAIAAVRRLPAEEQDAIAEAILSEVKEAVWDTRFAQSQECLAELADEALAEHRRGKTRKLNIAKI